MAVKAGVWGAFGAALEDFVLVLEADPGRMFNAQAEGTTFLERPLGAALPVSSVPALEAAKCAAAQGGEAFERYHLA